MKKESLGKILLGLGTGTLFGFFLHKGSASEHHAISGQLRLRDSSVLKIMGTATAVGAMGTQILMRLGLTKAKVKPLNTGGIVLGGTLFGTGMAILGYCPGTNMAAMGKGHKDAVAGMIGMFVGALAFVRLYPSLKPLIEKGSMGKRTLPEMTRTSPWLWTAAISAAMVLLPKQLEGEKVSRNH